MKTDDFIEKITQSEMKNNFEQFNEASRLKSLKNEKNFT